MTYKDGPRAEKVKGVIDIRQKNILKWTTFCLFLVFAGYMRFINNRMVRGSQ